VRTGRAFLAATEPEDVVAREDLARVLDVQTVGSELDGHRLAGETFCGVEPPMSETGVAEGVQRPGESAREVRALEIHRMVTDHPHRAEDLHRAPLAVFPLFVGAMPS
jgi:hypothetical protein